MDDASVVAFLQTVEREQFIYECAGVFWLWAELAILFAVREGRSVLLGKPRPSWLLRLLSWSAVFCVVLFPLLFRGWFLTGAATLATSSPQPETLAAAYTQGVLIHLAVWSIFVLAWVLLESLIVYEGARTYGVFSARCRRLLNASAALLLLSVAALPAYATALTPLGGAVQAADEALQPYRNAVYLHLRLAGVAWILVEWIAAVLLWRGQALLWKTVHLRKVD